MSLSLSDLIQQARDQIDDIQADDLEELLDEDDGVVLVDVREPYEYERAHIPNSLLIPRGMLEGAADPNNKHRIEALHEARDKTVVLYCETGARASMAAATLKLMGFNKVLNLAGGMKMWDAEDLPTESGEYTGKLP